MFLIASPMKNRIRQSIVEKVEAVNQCFQIAFFLFGVHVDITVQGYLLNKGNAVCQSPNG
jgi:hypothetical protein